MVDAHGEEVQPHGLTLAKPTTPASATGCECQPSIGRMYISTRERKAALTVLSIYLPPLYHYLFLFGANGREEVQGRGQNRKHRVVWLGAPPLAELRFQHMFLTHCEAPGYTLHVNRCQKIEYVLGRHVSL